MDQESALNTLGIITTGSIGVIARWSGTSLGLLHLSEEGGIHRHHLLHLEHGNLLLLFQSELALLSAVSSLLALLAKLTAKAHHLDLEGIVLPSEHAVLLSQALDGALELLEDLLLAVAGLAGRTAVGGEALLALLLLGLGLLVGGGGLVPSALGRRGGFCAVERYVERGEFEHLNHAVTCQNVSMERKREPAHIQLCSRLQAFTFGKGVPEESSSKRKYQNDVPRGYGGANDKQST